MGYTVSFSYYDTRDKKKIPADYYINELFDSKEEAEDSLLNRYFGNYNRIAAQYKIYGQRKPIKELLDLEKEIKEYQERLIDLAKPHYQGARIKTITCKNCGAVLPTLYCGRTYNNNCPICKVDLRPITVLRKENQYNAAVQELQRKYKQMIKLQKESSKYKIGWIVAVRSRW